MDPAPRADEADRTAPESPADEHKREDTRERECCAGAPQKHSGNLPSTDSRRWPDARRGQDPVRKEYEKEADEERRISDRASEDEHRCHSQARSYHQLGHPLHAPTEDNLREEQDGAEGLILGGGVDATRGQLRQKGRDLRSSSSCGWRVPLDTMKLEELGRAKGCNVPFAGTAA